MQIGTKVFERIVREAREKGVERLADLMEYTNRFGSFDREYRIECARHIYEHGDSKRNNE